MGKIKSFSPLCVGFGAVSFALFLTFFTSAPISGQEQNPPPFDFSDSFYLANGIDPTQILNRVNTAGNPCLPGGENCVLDNSNTDPNRRNVRILQTTGGFNNAGSLIYYSIMGMVTPNTFNNDAAGQQAKQIANSFRAFLFPKTPRNANCTPGSLVLSPALGNRRQDNVFDTRNGYFSNNPLGLWILAFVVYTQNAFVATSSGCQLVPDLADLAATNGTDLDGTPILKTADGIDGLVSKGLVEIRTRAQDGSQGFPWVI
jgi:hypothetical protein